MEYDIRKDQKRMGLFTRSGLWRKDQDDWDYLQGAVYGDCRIAGNIGIL